MPPPSVSRRARAAHGIVGAAGVVGFLCSGLYMHFGLAHLEGLDRATHLSFRSIHIYLLFASLLNLAVAPGARWPARRWAATLTLIGSVLLLSGPFVLGAAFIREPLVPDLDRPLTRLGVIASAAGIALLTLGRLGGDREH